MSGVPQRFWGTPIRYLQWAMHEKPAIFWSCVLGGMGPMCFVVVPPLRRWAGDEDPPQIPLTYPVPKGPRSIPQGFDDPK
ncbi:n19m, NADH-ubiquinone oxidoreductase 9.5 kDa subunit [Exophiala xenobiotica]|nr:n19m, NADH-ubiquinone oxidoreductase 9.5 kDa subunit [Exophiala xenobiotica]KAK5229690.1 n19m, NADH-ubiquinone oxidoreductase 9.5 kDa subunit [Exophiala xenobiotica]KAK5492071.1 n19m, NADH-ubiquinone oxidoreductase 9.5 kDa subunit [Exophiala xenobiotica]